MAEPIAHESHGTVVTEPGWLNWYRGAVLGLLITTSYQAYEARESAAEAAQAATVAARQARDAAHAAGDAYSEAELASRFCRLR